MSSCARAESEAVVKLKRRAEARRRMMFCVGAGEGRSESGRRKGEATPSSIGGLSGLLSASRTDSSAGELEFNLGGGAAFVCHRRTGRVSVAVRSISLTPRFSEMHDRILPPTALAVLLVQRQKTAEAVGAASSVVNTSESRVLMRESQCR